MAAEINKNEKNDLSTEDFAVAKVPSFAKIAWREIYSSKISLISLFFFLALTMTVFIWAVFIPEDATRINILMLNRAPSADHILGTDEFGRDMLSVLILGARNSLSVSFILTALSFIIGGLVGILLGFYGGHVDNVVMRFVDVISMLPALMVSIVLIVLVPEFNEFWLIAILLVFGWIGPLRTIRTRALQQGRLEYVHASKTLGTPNLVIIFREVMPNLVSILSGTFILTMAANIGVETGLTIIGFGLPPGTPSIGRLIMVATNPAFIEHRTWQWAPALILIVTISLSIVFVGQALNRAVDAKQRMK